MKHINDTVLSAATVDREEGLIDFRRHLTLLLRREVEVSTIQINDLSAVDWKDRGNVAFTWGNTGQLAR